MLKLLLSKNPIVHAMIKHCVEYSGEFTFTLACRNGIQLPTTQKYWKPVDYNKGQIREFVDILKSEEVEYKIVKGKFRNSDYTFFELVVNRI